METAAHLSNIITAVIAIGASVIGAFWWFSVRQRRSQRVGEALDVVIEQVERASELSDKVVETLGDDTISDSRKTRFLLMLIDRRIERVHFLFFLHFIHSNYRPHEIPDLLKRWKFKSPVQWPLERRDVDSSKSSE